MQPMAKADEEVAVLIAGGGGAGLTASMLPARPGVGTCRSAPARRPPICPRHTS
jgi:hypothetical protein